MRRPPEKVAINPVTLSGMAATEAEERDVAVAVGARLVDMTADAARSSTVGAEPRDSVTLLAASTPSRAEPHHAARAAIAS